MVSVKKLYEELELEVIRFDAEDVVTASSCASPYAGASYTDDNNCPDNNPAGYGDVMVDD